MAFKIITIPFDKKICEFNNEILDKFVNNKKIEEYKCEIINIEDNFYWTIFIKYNELEGINEKFISYDNLLIAFRKAKKRTKTKEAYKFEFNLERNILSLKKEINDNIYTPQKYKYFILKGLKNREISVASFRDRVIHHAIVNILEPIFEKTFIFDSYANRKNKGLLKAIKRLQSFIKTNKEYYLKCDIKKYFDNIEYTILVHKIKRKIKDRNILRLVEKIIRNDNFKVKGLPIGNLTSQFFANIYLNSFDHFIKEELKVKRYVRYMDDFIIILNTMEELKIIKKKIEEYLLNMLNLSLKKEATYFNKVDNGISFCGVRIFKNLIRVKRESITISQTKIKQKLKEYQNKEITEEELYKTLNSIFGYWKKYNTRNLRIKLIKKFNLI